MGRTRKNRERERSILVELGDKNFVIKYSLSLTVPSPVYKALAYFITSIPGHIFSY
jgi:hypothetical protein